jgi:hypothetical protein
MKDIYKIVRAEDPEVLTDKVNICIKAGFLPFGSLAVDGCKLMQSMTRGVELIEEKSMSSIVDCIVNLDCHQGTPQDLRPVLTKIEGNNCLGKTEWFEVVYFDEEQTGQWKSYSGSNTFDDGEKVLSWKYADECFNND